MQPITMFETHFKTAQAMLKVYQLLSSEEDLTATNAYVPKLREMMNWEADEPLTLLLNDMFLGAVRENANVSATFFGRPNLALLLRQAVASSCSAMDVFFPSLLEAHLSKVVKVRQRNFLPKSGEVKTLFQDFRLKLDDLPPFLEEQDAEERWNLLSRKILTFCQHKTLSNVEGISAVMMMLGVQEPWHQIAAEAGMQQTALQNQIKAAVKRRNDIVHRGDRLIGDTEGQPEPINLAWTKAHVNAVESVAHVCDALARKSIRNLTEEPETAGAT